MRQARGGRFLLRVVASLALLGTLVLDPRAGSTASTERGDSSRPPTLELKAGSRRFELGEPIRLEWTIRNRGRRALSLLAPTDSMRVIDAVRIEIDVLRPDGRTLLIRDEPNRSMWPRVEELIFHSLPPGRSLKGTLVLKERSGWVVHSDPEEVRSRGTGTSSPGWRFLEECFEEPGRYELRGRIETTIMLDLMEREQRLPADFWSGTLSAGPITLDILPRKRPLEPASPR